MNTPHGLATNPIGTIKILNKLAFDSTTNILSWTGDETACICVRLYGKKKWIPADSLSGEWFRKNRRAIARGLVRMQHPPSPVFPDIDFVQAMFAELSPEKQVAMVERFTGNKYIKNICSGCNKIVKSKQKCLSHECSGLCTTCHRGMDDRCPGCNAKQEVICPICITVKPALKLHHLVKPTGLGTCGHCVCHECWDNAYAGGNPLTKCPTCRAPAFTVASSN